MTPHKKRESPATPTGDPQSKPSAHQPTSTNGTDPVPAPVAKAHRRGWHVIPQNFDKGTPIRWKPYQEIQPNDEELRRWAADYPNCLWAVITGQASDVIVFDFDGDEGIATMEALGLTPILRTPRGGAHVYVKAPGWPVKGGARVDIERFPNMDLRADGQLATFYGTNPLVDGSYKKVDKGRVVAYDELPVELQRLCAERKKQPHRQAVDVPEGFSDFTGKDVLLREALEAVHSGQTRNAAGFLLALQLRDERYSEDDAETVMMKYAEAVADVGDHSYVPQEAYNSLRSAFSSPPREPRSMGKFKHGDGYPQTDYGNAERLVARHGDDLRYVTPWKSWLVWDQNRWVKDATEEVERRAKDTARHIYRTAVELEHDDARLKFMKFARATEQAARLHAMVKLAESEDAVVVVPQQLDADPWMLNVANGTLDLRTGKLHEHRRSDLNTKLAPVTYDAKARSPRWETFLAQVLPSPELRAFIQQAVGYSLTADTSEHVAFLLWGTGANGKSTFLEIVRALLGDYSQQAASDLLMTKRGGGIPNDVARLPGARFVTVSETEEGRQLAEETFKRLTGEDRVAARFLYGEFFEFTPVAKFWLATNHKPEVKGAGEALWRRIHLVPFTVTIPDDQRDRRLVSKLRKELPGILRWAVDGCLQWQHRGRFTVPEEVRRATEEYREESDVIGMFLEDCCDVDPQLSDSASGIYARYEWWCGRMGQRFPLTQNKFGRILTERGFPGGRAGKEKLSVRYGLRIRPATARLHAVEGDG